MSELYCKDCREYTRHGVFKDRNYLFEGEYVKTCKQCGELRTKNNPRIIEGEMMHKKKGVKYKKVKYEEQYKNDN